MANGTRDDSITTQNIDLYYNFTKNGALFNASDFQKVEIYDTLADAQAGTNIIETITDITNPSTGHYLYTATATGSAGTFFDRVYIIPQAGEAVWDPTGEEHISPFYVREETFGGAAPGSNEKIRIYLNIFDSISVAQKGDKVKVKMNVKHAWYGNNLIKQEIEQFIADVNGQVVMDLIENQTLTSDTFPVDTGTDRTIKTVVFYEITVGSKLTFRKYVDKGSVSVNFADLRDVDDVITDQVF